jgi:membrane protease YdiL (CAAX protease family)
VTPPSDPQSERHWREVWTLYGLTLAITLGLTLMQGAVGWIRGYITTIVAFAFIFLPMELLHRRGLEPADFGIHSRQRFRAVRNALLVMGVCFPAYAIGYHVWQTQWLDRELAIAEARYDQWPSTVQDPPRLQAVAPGDVWFFTTPDRLWLNWHLPKGQRFEARLTSDAPMRAQGKGTRLIENGATVRGSASGRVAFKTKGSTIRLEAKADGTLLPAERLRLGTALVRADGNPFEAERSYWWLFNLIMLQLLLVALPEELFYRGYLQTRLDGMVGRERMVFGVSVNVTSIVLTSALFALGHIITIWHPARLAVFFPSLIFGWMRRATGGILAPILFHAACNLLVDILSLHYR